LSKHVLRSEQRSFAYWPKEKKLKGKVGKEEVKHTIPQKGRGWKRGETHLAKKKGGEEVHFSIWDQPRQAELMITWEKILIQEKEGKNKGRGMLPP